MGCNTTLVDVSQLDELPRWLKGVPTIVHTPTGSVYEGSNCLLVLSENQQRCHEEEDAMDVDVIHLDTKDGEEIPPWESSTFIASRSILDRILEE